MLWPWGRARLFLAAAALRLALLLAGAAQDAALETPYTDVDYGVVTDGARELAAGRSPFRRATFRYSPLFAALALPNLALPAAGKLLFAGADLGVGAALVALLEGAGAAPAAADSAAALALLNPLLANVSTRGSGDALTALAVLAALLAARARRPAAAGALLGLAAHARLYPAVHALPLAAGAAVAAAAAEEEEEEEGGEGAEGQEGGEEGREEGEEGQEGGEEGGEEGEEGEGGRGGDEKGARGARDKGARGPDEAGARRRGGARAGSAARAAGPSSSSPPAPPALPRRARTGLAAVGAGAAVAASAVATAAGLTAGAAALCGPAYAREALAHHLTRVDARHNFSAYFLPLYLSDARGARALARAAFAPQAAALALLGGLWAGDPPRAVLLQTLAFVTLNKVVTAQYFAWWLALLPLAAARAGGGGGFRRPRALAAAGAAWAAAELAWLANAGALELEGADNFGGVWAASLGLLAASVAVLVLLVLE